MRQVQRPEFGRWRHEDDAAAGALILAAELAADQIVVSHTAILDLRHFAPANRHHTVGLETRVDHDHITIFDQLF